MLDDQHAESVALPAEDDLTHYMRAVTRLSAENGRLRARYSRLLEAVQRHEWWKDCDECAELIDGGGGA